MEQDIRNNGNFVLLLPYPKMYYEKIKHNHSYNPKISLEDNSLLITILIIAMLYKYIC